MSDMQHNNPDWERQTIEKLAFSAIKEQRRSRMWGILFKSLTFIYLFALLFIAMDWVGGSSAAKADHTALIDIQGVIGSGEEVSADSVVSSLQAAFENKRTKGLILRINSPGGSPVQSGIINDEIKRLRKLHPEVPVYAVVEDVCASGGYYIAAAADKIYVDKASIVGSIGVLMDGFGFTGTMEKLGVERRLLTAGENKAILDPFSPPNEKHQQFAQAMLNEVHQQFIDIVREGRGDRLKETSETFSGLFWSGETSIKMGLADALGSSEYVAREVIKQEKIVDFTVREDFASRFAKRLGASLANQISIGGFRLQ
ncbi:MAG: S49 family peptidase [Methylophilaceae bacterium]|nr:S49 family peptidase [Methylophilaceae bacterium]